MSSPAPAMPGYSDQALRHFRTPHNVGRVDSHHASARIEHPACGDRLEVWLARRGSVVERIGFLASGCPGTIAAASAATCLVEGREIDEALVRLSEDAIDRALGGLPPGKAHCLRIAAEVIREALQELGGEETP